MYSQSYIYCKKKYVCFFDTFEQAQEFRRNYLFKNFIRFGGCGVTWFGHLIASGKVFNKHA